VSQSIICALLTLLPYVLAATKSSTYGGRPLEVGAAGSLPTQDLTALKL